MTGKAANESLPEVRVRTVRMVLGHEKHHSSRWATVMTIAAKTGCAGQTLREWVKGPGPTAACALTCRPDEGAETRES